MRLRYCADVWYKAAWADGRELPVGNKTVYQSNGLGVER